MASAIMTHARMRIVGSPRYSILGRDKGFVSEEEVPQLGYTAKENKNFPSWWEIGPSYNIELRYGMGYPLDSELCSLRLHIDSS